MGPLSTCHLGPSTTNAWLCLLPVVSLSSLKSSSVTRGVTAPFQPRSLAHVSLLQAGGQRWGQRPIRNIP